MVLYDGLQDGAFGKCSGHEAEPLVHGINVPIKQASQSFVAPATMQGHKEKSVTQKGALTCPRWHPDLRPQAPRTVRSTLLLFISYLVTGIFIAARMNKDSGHGHFPFQISF